jgi:transketolase
MRLKRGEVPVMESTADQVFRIGRADVVREGDAGVIFVCGLMVTLALDAAEELSREGHDMSVVNVSTLKPLDTELIVEVAGRTQNVVTAENHSIIGGLGSAVAETLMEAGVSCRYTRVGIADRFGEGASAPYLFEKYGLTKQAILAACRRLRDRA